MKKKRCNREYVLKYIAFNWKNYIAFNVSKVMLNLVLALLDLEKLLIKFVLQCALKLKYF
jgi:hypothetical protein